jgi:hypothetical protein
MQWRIVTASSLSRVNQDENGATIKVREHPAVRLLSALQLKSEEGAELLMPAPLTLKGCLCNSQPSAHDSCEIDRNACGRRTAHLRAADLREV